LDICCARHRCRCKLFRSFPVDAVIRAEWMQKIGRHDFNPTKNTRTCSQNFKEADFNFKRFGAASAVMLSLHRSVMVKKKLCRKAKFLIYRLIYVPTVTYGHELWAMTKRTSTSDPKEDPGHGDHVSRVAWERLGIPLKELEEVAGEREVWASLLRKLPPRPGNG
uniref:THAP-type domain-containing protein n=1 Tax=Gouania willdenowi TaxID=441366 RepID=A0A8C5E5T7_GOUWI